MNNESDNILNRDQREDDSLIRAFHKGERSCFDTLVIRHKDRVFNLCLRFLGDYQEAEDAAQDVFVKIFRSLDRFRFESSFSTWIYRITINTCKNRVKSLDYRYRKTDIRVDTPDDIGDNCLSEQKEDASGPDTELENKEKMEILQKAIGSLPPDQRTIVILRDIQGLSYDEIADVTGFKSGTIKSRLSRARSSLRNRLGDIL